MPAAAARTRRSKGDGPRVSIDPERYLAETIRVMPYWPRGHYLELAPPTGASTRGALTPRGEHRRNLRARLQVEARSWRFRTFAQRCIYDRRIEEEG
jgi:hypothetical protein